MSSISTMTMNRPIIVHTPLGKDILRFTGLRGREAISQLFSYRLDLISQERGDLPFDKLLGQPITLAIEMPGRKQRYLTGLCKSFCQGERDTTFTNYEMEIVPHVWLLTKRTQSRIFQHMSIPEILKKVFAGFKVLQEIQGTFDKRDYCVQYRESDFDFASRLMEEEGIFYFFKHTQAGHVMVLANTVGSHPDLVHEPSLIFDRMEGGQKSEFRVSAWKKLQEVRSGRVTLRDFCFEVPDEHFSTSVVVPEKVQVGTVSHLQNVAGNKDLEIYDYPGEFAQRFDGIDAGGGDRADDIQKIYKDKERTAKIRMQEETAAGIRIQAIGDLRHLSAGHRFTLENHYNANGNYILTEIETHVRQPNHRSGDTDEFKYSVQFTCIPFAQPYRPARKTERPFVRGSQTATVVGPPGEEIYTDKYSRVKVQFPWDREGKMNADSSCWIRVSTTWADRGFGFVQIPRIGQEVIVDFLEGDPDQPIITGCVFNGKNMPPQSLPEKKMISGFKSNSYPGGGGNNEISLDDTKGKERMFVNAQFNQDSVVGNNRTEKVGVDSAEQIGNNLSEQVGNNKSVAVAVNESTTIGSNQTLSVGSNQSVTVGSNQSISVGSNIIINAGTSITLKCGAAMIHMNQAGLIAITGTIVNMAGAIMANVGAPITTIDGILTTTNGVLTVSAGVVNKVVGSRVTIDGNPVKINS